MATAKKKHTNPQVKVGDILLVIKANNSNKTLTGKTVTVIQERGQRNYILVKDKDTNTSQYLYYSGPADEFTLATRELRIKTLEESNKELLEKIAENNEQIDFLIKYETEEDFVADKLDAILTAHSKSNSKTTRVKAITEILKELKKSDLL